MRILRRNKVKVVVIMLSSIFLLVIVGSLIYYSLNANSNNSTYTGSFVANSKQEEILENFLDTDDSKDNTIRAKHSNTSIDTKNIVDGFGLDVVLSENSNLPGSIVYIPPASINGEINLSVGYCDIELDSQDVKHIGKGIFIDTDGYQDFMLPIEVTIKYDTNDITDFPVPCYYDEVTRTLIPVTIKSVNQQAKTVSFLTLHASIFTVIFSPIIAAIAPNPEDWGIVSREASTSYLPNNDGFAERNQGSTYQSGGECFGMASFSLWYYNNKKQESGNLFNAFSSGSFGTRYYRNGIEDEITIQDIIATRAHRYVSRKEDILLSNAEHYNNSYMNTFGEIIPDNQMAMFSIINSISMLNEPVCVVFKGMDINLFSDNRGIGHALIAYRYKAEGHKVYIYTYDCNRPGSNDCMIIYDMAKDSFIVKIEEYTYPIDINIKLYCLGPGTFNHDERFEQIYQDALLGFNNTELHINITSHEYGEVVNEPYTTLLGKIDKDLELSSMGENIVDIIDIITSDGNIYTTTIDLETYTFEIEIPLVPGENYLNFNLGYFEDNDKYIQKHILDHDMNSDFLINSEIDEVAMLITLTWDEQDDVDLYLIDPSGDVAWYRNMTTTDGAELDVDDTTSYGPEHITLTYDNNIRWGEEYRVRLHFYKGTEPTFYNLTITANIGTPYAFVKKYSGVINYSSSANSHPINNGDDWVDIATIIPRQ
ncbi:MAG: hypothetical protein KAQ68_04845 [Clostridiales bacterium]|nr:hypothetical protein [Clostridiales bacterium]